MHACLLTATLPPYCHVTAMAVKKVTAKSPVCKHTHSGDWQEGDFFKPMLGEMRSERENSLGFDLRRFIPSSAT